MDPTFPTDASLAGHVRAFGTAAATGLLVPMIAPSPWEYRHARLMVPVRVAIGIWLLTLTGVLYGYGRGGWWGALLVPAATLHFYFAYRVRQAVQR